MIPIGPFEPDKYLLGTGLSAELFNVLPLANSYSPAKEFEPVTSGVGATVVGGFQARRADGTYAIFASTQTALWLYDQGTDTWTDVSRLVGGAYVGPNDGDYWWFIQRGDDVLCGNQNDDIQLYTLSSSTDFALCGGSPPKAGAAQIVNNFIVLSRLASNAYTIEWGGFSSSTSWTVGTDSCGFQTFIDGGEVYGVGGKETGYVIQQDCVRQMVFQSSGNAVFSFQRIEGARGCSAPASIVNVGNLTFYYGNAGFQAISGITSQNVGLDRINEYFKTVCVPTSVRNIIGSVDPRATRVGWAFKSTSATSISIFDRILIYDFGRDKWVLVACSLDYLAFNGLATLGYGLDALDAFGTLETLTISFDSSVWQGGVPTFGGWGQNSVAESAQHDLGFFVGEPMEAILETAETQLNPPKRAFVSAVTVYGGPSTAMVQVAGRETNSNDDVAVYNNEFAQSVDGSWPARLSSSYHKSKIRIPAGETWTQIAGIDYTYTGEGGR